VISNGHSYSDFVLGLVWKKAADLQTLNDPKLTAVVDAEALCMVKTAAKGGQLGDGDYANITERCCLELPPSQRTDAEKEHCCPPGATWNPNAQPPACSACATTATPIFPTVEFSIDDSLSMNEDAYPADPTINTTRVAVVQSLLPGVISSLPSADSTGNSHSGRYTVLIAADTVTLLDENGVTVNGCPVTDQCYLDIASSPDYGGAVTLAINYIINLLQNCWYALSTPQTVVAVSYYPSGGDARSLAGGDTSCVGSQWWQTDSTTITLCPDTCAAVKADANARVEVTSSDCQ
jgi:hypothetical protein